MKNLSSFLFGCAFTIALLILIAASSDTGRTIMLLEPVQPSSTVILHQFSGDKSLDKQAIPFLKKGYIVRHVSMATSSSGGTIVGYMVLEKY